jgi:hypothetical protein
MFFFLCFFHRLQSVACEEDVGARCTFHAAGVCSRSAKLAEILDAYGSVQSHHIQVLKAFNEAQ